MAEQTDDHYSEQTWLCTAEEEPGEENGPDEAWGRRHEQGVLWWSKTKLVRWKKMCWNSFKIRKHIMMNKMCDKKIQNKVVSNLKIPTCSKTLAIYWYIY